MTYHEIKSTLSYHKAPQAVTRNKQDLGERNMFFLSAKTDNSLPRLIFLFEQFMDFGATYIKNCVLNLRFFPGVSPFWIPRTAPECLIRATSYSACAHVQTPSVGTMTATSAILGKRANTMRDGLLFLKFDHFIKEFFIVTNSNRVGRLFMLLYVRQMQVTLRLIRE